MEGKQYTFRQAATLALITGLLGALPAIISAWQASLSKDEANVAKTTSLEIEKNQRIRQERMDERDRIFYSLKTEDPDASYIMPVDDNEAWRKYFLCTESGKPRGACAVEQNEASMGHVNSIISEPLSDSGT